ncbi:MAG: hypothetical protein ACREEW_11720, partial [Caulobacteraceae bacterium]
MKTLLFTAASLAALTLGGTAFAAGNATTIDQIGYANNATVDQTGSPSGAVAQVTQGTAATDEYNSASVTQGGGANNQASVKQSQGSFGAAHNPTNSSTSNQQGADGTATVIQVGNSTSSISQLSGSTYEHALVGQLGNNDTSSIQQGGTEELAVVNQESGPGNTLATGSNSASIVQSGTGDNVDTASVYTNTPSPGPGDLHWHENVPPDSVLPGSPTLTVWGPVGAVVDQVGSNNVGAINQAGVHNFADVSQENDNAPGGNYGAVTQGAGLTESDGVMFQWGQSNTVVINQSGAGMTFSTAWQNGTSNRAYSTQIGSEHSVISQGVIGDDVSWVTPVQADYASVDQSGGGDTSTVTQLGDNDTANVSQFAANATSTISQSGSY